MRSPLRPVVAVLAVTAVLAAACDANSTDTGTKNDGKITKGGTLTVYSSETEFPFEPAISQSLAITSLGLVHRRLTTWDIRPGRTPRYVPDLATTTGTPSDGGKTWTYTLKAGLTFSNGQPITSGDVKYGIERSFAPELSGGLGYHKSLLVGGDSYKGPYSGKELASVETPNDRTIRFRLTSAYGDWPWIASMPAFAPVPKSADTNPATYGQHPVASGPYVVSQYKQGTSVTLSRNPKWSAKTDSIRGAGPDKIVVKLGQEDTVAAQQVIGDSGEARSGFGADPVPPAQLAQIAGNPSARDRLEISNPGALVYLAMNTKRGVLSNVSVRQAIEYAIDKRAFQLASGGERGGGLASTLITPGIPGRKDYDLYKTSASGDVPKARSLLAKAGVTPASAGTLRIVTRNEGTYVSQAEAVQESLKKLGIATQIIPLDVNAWQDRITSDAGDYDLTVSSWQPDFPSANGNIQPLFDSSQIGGGNYNLSRYSNPQVDSLIARATATVDPTAAQQLWAQADRRIMQDAPVVPLIFKRNAFLHGSDVTNFDDSGFPNYPNYLRLSVG